MAVQIHAVALKHDAISPHVCLVSILLVGVLFPRILSSGKDIKSSRLILLESFAMRLVT